MTRVLLRRKLVIPATPPGTIGRGRLTALLDEAINAGKHVAMVAQSGFGKTTLLAQWSASKANVGWLSLDAEDTDTEVFLRYVIALFEMAVAGFETQAPTLLERARDRTGALAVVDALLGDLDEQAQEPAFVILDDWHLAASPTHDLLLERMLRYLPGPIRLVLTSRKVTALPIATMQAKGEILLLGEADLAFDSIESDAVRAEHGGSRVGTPAETWPAAATIRPELLDGYIEEQIMGEQPVEIRRLLERAALFEAFDAHLCESTLGIRLPSAERDRLVAVRLVAVAEDGRLEVTRPLRDMLQRRAATTIDRSERLRLLVASGEQCWKDGQRISALLRWIDAGELKRAAERLALVAESWLGEDKLDALATVIMAIGDDENFPGLLLAQGEIHRRWGEFERAQDRLERALIGFKLQKEDRSVALAALRLAQTQASRGNSAEALLYLESARAGLPDGDPLFTDLLNLEGGLALLDDRVQDAVEFFESSLSCAQKHAIPYAQARAAHNLGVCYTRLGDFTRALLCYDIASTPVGGRHAAEIWMSPINRALVLVHLGRAEEAIKQAQEALAMVRRFKLTREEGFALRTLGFALAAINDAAGAMSCYETAERLARRTHNQQELAYALYYQSDALAATGDFDAALSLWPQIEELLGGREALERNLEFGESRAKLLVGMGRQQEAERLIADLVARARKRNYRYLERELERLVKSFKVATAKDLDSRSVAVLTARTPTGIAKSRGITSQDPPEESARTPRPDLTINFLGGMKVRRGEEPVTEKEWKSARAKVLLAYLIHYPEGATKARLLEALFPNEETTDSSVHVTVRRLRLVLEPHLGKGDPSGYIIHSDGIYAFNRQARVAVDTWALDAPLRPGLNRLDGELQLRSLQASLEGYTGEFLPEFELDWVLALRYKFRDKALELCRRQLQLLGEGSHNQALNVARRALEIDPLAEEFHRELILRFLESGDRHRAVEQFQLCKRQFRGAGGMSVPEDLEALVRDLVDTRGD